MGVVYKAKQRSLNRIVALKMILAGKLADDVDIERFHREAKAAGGLKHSHIVPVHEVGEYEGRHYFTMDFIEGKSLAEVIREETLAPEKAAQLVRAVADAVQYAHDRDTIHRDLKPANILIDSHGQPQITDFGLAKVIDSVDDESKSELTASGQILGTPSYMAPEQAAGKTQSVGPASDIYAMGAVLYAALAGRGPFVADSAVDTLMQVLKKDPVPLRQLNTKIPKDLENICLKCLNKEPHKRYGTAQLLADDLERFIERRPVLARPISMTSRVVRWGRRNKVVATLLTLCVVFLIGGTAVSSYYAYESRQRADAEAEERRRADHTANLYRIANTETSKALVREQRASEEATRERDEATRQRDRAEAFLYASNIRSAQNELKAGDIDRAERLLELCRWDLQGWEYRYLSNLVSLGDEGGNDNKRPAATTGARLLLSKNGTATRFALSHDGQFLALAIGEDLQDLKPKIMICDTGTGNVIHELAGHEGRISSLDFSPVDNVLLSSSEDMTARIWNLDQGEEQLPRITHANPIQCAVFSPDGSRILCGGGFPSIPPGPNKESELRIYDTDTRALSRELEGHPSAVMCIAFSSNGKLIASGGFGEETLDSAEIRIWDSSTGDLIHVLEGPAFTAIDIEFSPDSHSLAVAGGLGKGPKEIQIFDCESGLETKSLQGHPNPIGGVQFSPDGSRLLSFGLIHQFGVDNTGIRIWDSQSGAELLNLEVDEKLIQASWDHTGNSIFVMKTDHEKTSLVQWQSGDQTETARVLRAGTASGATDLAYFPTGERLVSVGIDKKIHIWDLKTGRLEQSLTGCSQLPLSVALSPDGNRIISTGSNGSGTYELKVWELPNGDLKQSFESTRSKFHSVDFFDTGGAHLYLTTANRSRVSNFETEVDRFVMPAKFGSAFEFASSPDGRFVAAAHMDKSVRIWDIEKQNEHVKMKGELKGLLCLDFSPDGEFVATGGANNKIQIWRAEIGEQLSELEGHTKSVLSLAFSPDSKSIVSGSWDQSVRVWDVATAKQTAKFDGHTHMVRTVTISPDGKQIASAVGLEDMTIRLWPMP